MKLFIFYQRIHKLEETNTKDNNDVTTIRLFLKALKFVVKERVFLLVWVVCIQWQWMATVYNLFKCFVTKNKKGQKTFQISLAVTGVANAVPLQLQINACLWYIGLYKIKIWNEAIFSYTTHTLNLIHAVSSGKVIKYWLHFQQ